MTGVRSSFLVDNNVLAYSLRESGISRISITVTGQPNSPLVIFPFAMLCSNKERRGTEKGSVINVLRAASLMPGDKDGQFFNKNTETVVPGILLRACIAAN